MFQDFEAATDPAQGAPRLAALRAHLATRGLDGFLIPRADAHQGEYVAARDERLAWLTGFTGSAGFAIVLPGVAGVFIDGRYRVQVRQQVDLAQFTPVPWPETKPADWLRAQLPAGGRLGFDPWLHTEDEIARIEAGLAGSGIVLDPCANAVDAVWPDQPAPPCGAAFAHPVALAGRTSAATAAAVVLAPDATHGPCCKHWLHRGWGTCYHVMRKPNPEGSPAWDWGCGLGGDAPRAAGSPARGWRPEAPASRPCSRRAWCPCLPWCRCIRANGK